MADTPERQPGNDSLEGEFSSQTEKLRAEGIGKIMNDGLPKEGEPGAEQYGQIWDKVGKYVAAVQSDGEINKALAGYLQDSENARAFNDVIGELKAGRAPASFTAVKEGSLPNRHYLSALTAFESVAKAAIRSEGGKRRAEEDQLSDADLIGAEGEAARRFIRMAEILDVESNAVMIKNNIHPLGTNGMGTDYADRFDRFAQRRDVPGGYRDRAREMAANLRIDALQKEGVPQKEEAAEGTVENPYQATVVEENTEAPLGTAENPYEATVVSEESTTAALGTTENPYEATIVSEEDAKNKELTIEEIQPVSREQLMSAQEGTRAGETLRGITVALEYDPSRKLFGRENPIRVEDIQQMQAQIELLTRENSPKNAFAVARLVAKLQQCDVTMADNNQLNAYLQRQRDGMQKYGPRALAQYLAYGQYIGSFTELAPEEETWLLAAVQDRLKNDPAHTGLARLSANMRYIGVKGYTPELVRQGIQEEIATLTAAGKFDMAVEEMRRAKQAGVEVKNALMTRGVVAEAVDKRCREYAQKNQWKELARLRVSAAEVWQHVELGINNEVGLLNHFDLLRSQAEERGAWDSYAAYAADVNNLSGLEVKLAQTRTSESQSLTNEQATAILEEATPSTTKEAWAAERARQQAANQRPSRVSVEEPVFNEVIDEPVVRGGILGRVLNFFSRRRRESASRETPTNQAL